MDKDKILYVDDEVINLMLFEAILESEYEVITAENGFKGLETIEANKDLKVIVSDMKMPEMNGVEFITKAKQRYPHLVFYLVTGFETTDEIQAALDSGLITKYFKKPFNMKEISKEIKKVFQDV